MSISKRWTPDRIVTIRPARASSHLAPWRTTPLACALLSLQLAAASAAVADIFTVGPGGSYATIQEAIDAATADGGDNEVRIAQGSYRENPKIVFYPNRLEVSGGWEAGFLRRVPNWELTTILAEHEDDGLVVECNRGEVELRNLKITRDSVAPIGRGMRAQLREDCRVSIVGTRITGHHALPVTFEDPVQGAGILVRYTERVGRSSRSSFALKNSSIDNNRLGNQRRLVDSDQCGTGAGASVGAKRATITGNTFEGNVLEPRNPAESHCTGAGLFLSLGSLALDSRGDLSDNTFRGNQSLAVRPDDGSSSRNDGIAMILIVADDGVLEARRNRVTANLADPDTPGNQVELFPILGGTLLFTDSLVADGSVDAISALGLGEMDSSEIVLTNLTLVGNRGSALRAFDDVRVTVSNTISFGNGDDTLARPGVDVAPSNWIGSDPLFVDRAGGDYRLRSDSPAIDAGDNEPHRDLGPFDLDQRERVVGGAVDIGAYERQAGAPGSVCRALDLTVPATAPVCRCFDEPFGIFTRCTFALRDWLLVQRFPRIIPPGQGFDIDLRALSPQRTNMGLRFSQLIDGKPRPLAQGTALLRIQPDELATGAVSGTGPQRSGLYPIRTEVIYSLPDVLDENGQPFKARVELEVMATASQQLLEPTERQ